MGAMRDRPGAGTPWLPARKATGLDAARAVRPSAQFRLAPDHQGRSVVDVACQFRHSTTMTLDVYAHVFVVRHCRAQVSAGDQVEQARRDVSKSCPSASGVVEKS